MNWFRILMIFLVGVSLGATLNEEGGKIRGDVNITNCYSLFKSAVINCYDKLKQDSAFEKCVIKHREYLDYCSVPADVSFDRRGFMVNWSSGDVIRR